MTLACGLALVGFRFANRHGVATHRKWMMVSGSLVGLWLVAYVTKQMFVGRDRFGGTKNNYRSLSFPILILYISLAMATIGLGATLMFIGLPRTPEWSGGGANGKCGFSTSAL